MHSDDIAARADDARKQLKESGDGPLAPAPDADFERDNAEAIRLGVGPLDPTVLDEEPFENTPEERADLEALVALGVDITRPLEEQSAEAQEAYRKFAAEREELSVPFNLTTVEEPTHRTYDVFFRVQFPPDSIVRAATINNQLEITLRALGGEPIAAQSREYIPTKKEPTDG